MNASDYLALPWTIRRHEHDDDGSYISLTIDELPGFVAAGRDDDEAEETFWDALSAFIDSYLDAGETPPSPRTGEGAQLELPTVVKYRRPELIARYPAEGSKSRINAPTTFHAMA